MSSNQPSYPYQQRLQHQGQNSNQTFQPQGPQGSQYGRQAEYTATNQRWSDFTPSQQPSYEPPPQHRQQHAQVPGMNIGVNSNRGGLNPRETLTSSGTVSTSGPQPSARTATASPIPSNHRQDSAAFNGGYNYATMAHVQSYQQPATSIADVASMAVSSSGTGRGRVSPAGHESTPASGFAGYTQYPGHFTPATSVMGPAPQYRTSGPQRADEYFDHTHHSPATSASNYGALYQTADTARPTPSASTYSPVYQTGAAPVYAQGYQAENSRRYQQEGTVTQQQVSRTVTPAQTHHQTPSTVVQTYQMEQYSAGVTTQQATTQHPRPVQRQQPITFPPPPAANAPSRTTTSYATAIPQPQQGIQQPKHHDKGGGAMNWTSPAPPPPPPEVADRSQGRAAAARGMSHEEQQKIQNEAILGTTGVIRTEQEKWDRNEAGPMGNAQEQSSRAPQQIQQSQTQIHSTQQAYQLQPTNQPQQTQQPQPAVHLARPWPAPHQYQQYSQPPPVSQPAPQLQTPVQPKARPPQYQPQREPEPEPQYPPQAQPVPPQEPTPPPCAASQPRPPPPLNKDLMEQQMKIMVERMRYYQAADPATFQTVWDNVRKNGQAGSTGSEDRRAIMPAAAGMVRSESAASERTVVYTPSQAPAKVAGVKGVDLTPRHAQNAHPTRNSVPVSAQPTAPPPTQTQNQPQYQPFPPPPPSPSPPTLNPPQDALHLRTAQAVSKYLVKTSGRCPAEEVIVDLLHRIKSFPVLCGKLESMGYQFHRGSFSRFLLAEVDGGKDEAAVEEAEMEVAEDQDVVMGDDETDNGGSRVLGEIGDDQIQLMKEASETREAEVRRVISAPSSPAHSANMEEGRPGKSPASEGADLQTSQPHKTTAVCAPETPAVSNRHRTALPTPVSAAPIAPMPPSDSPTPVARIVAPVFNPSTQPQPQGSVYHPLPDDRLRPSPGLDFPRHPTPQSVKAAHAAPPRNPEMKQFVSPSLVYRPPTPPTPPLVINVDSSPSLSPTPPLVIDVDSSSSLPPPETCLPATVDQMVSPLNEQRTSEQPEQEFPSSRKLTKVVKLRLKNLNLPSQNTSATSSPPSSPVPTVDDVRQPVVGRPMKTVIDLTASATPEPQINRAPQLPASAPNPRNPVEKERQWLDPRNREPASTPTIQRPMPIPQTAPIRGVQTETTKESPMLFKPISQKKLPRKPQYNPATIARDIQIATGRSPKWVRPLNAHLDPLRTSGLITLDADLETVRWDILDPGPVGFAVGYDARIDDDEDGGYNGELEGVDVAVARAPVMFNNRAAMKGMVGQAVAPSPTPAARGRTRVRKLDTLSASVMRFQNPEMGFTTTSNGTGNADGRANSNDDHNHNGSNGSNGSTGTNGGRASWGGFSAPTPRSGSRTASGLRHVMTPDAAGNFAVVIRSPSVSSADRSRAPESSNARNLKRKLDGKDKEKGTPATKKAVKPPKPSAKKKEEKEMVMEMRPSGFKVFKCKWKLCPAELHNFETLHRHVIKAHCKLAGYGGYPCYWECCSRSPTREMKKAAATNRGPAKVVVARVTWDFDTPAQWEAHVVTSHLEGVKNEIGVGPSVGPYDHEVAGSDVDYLSDSFGHQVTPIARLAPHGHVFLPPPGYEFSSPHSSMNRHLQRARLLGAGMEGDEAADLRANDDGQGIYFIVRRIVPAEDVSLPGVSGSSTSPSQGAKEKGKGKGKGKVVEKEKPLEGLGRGSDEAGPSNLGAAAFTVYDDEEYCL